MDFVKCVLSEAIQPRNKCYMKIIRLDFSRDHYDPIRVPDDELSNMGLGVTDKISTWFKGLAKSPIIHDEDKEKFGVFADADKMRDCFKKGSKYPTFVHRRKKDDKYVLAVSVLEPSENYSPENEEVYLYVIDIGHIYFRAYADIVHRLGERDMKTGVYSRNAFDMELIKLSSSNKQIGVMYSDVNGLRYINDNYGRQTGDKVINEFTGWLLNTFPKYKCYRVCGEEFVVIAEVEDADSFVRAVEKARDYMWQHKPLASIGYAVGKGIEVGPLLDKAEAEMYIEKKKFYEQFPKFV